MKLPLLKPNTIPCLNDVLVLELAGERCPIACAFAGRLLAEMGAVVLKIEPPEGDPTRRIGPFLEDTPDLNRSLVFWYYNTNKMDITLDILQASAGTIFDTLLAHADVLLHALHPDDLAKVGLTREAIDDRNPLLIVSEVSPFGCDGPYRDYLASDVMHQAMGGLMASTGYHDVEGSPPIAGDGGQAWHLGGQWTVIGTLAALFCRDQDGRGQRVETAIHDACSISTEIALPTYDYTGNLVIRQTGREAHDVILPPWQYRCADGRYVSFVPMGFGPDRWTAVVEWLKKYGLEEDLAEDRYYIPEVLQEELHHVCDVLARFFATRSAEEVSRGIQACGLVAWVLNAPEDLLDDPHLKAREFFLQVEQPELERSFTYPGTPWFINGEPLRASRRAPLLGEHNLPVYEALGLSRDQIIAMKEGGLI